MESCAGAELQPTQTDQKKQKGPPEGRPQIQEESPAETLLTL